MITGGGTFQNENFNIQKDPHGGDDLEPENPSHLGRNSQN